MDISGPVAILLFFLLLLVDMFFYGFDAAIDNLNEKEILHKAEEEKDRRSVRLSEMVSRPGIYINTVQLVITLINILMGAFYLNIWLQTIDKGLHVINGAEYYFDQNGIMQTGEFVADGKLFTTNESGAVISKKYMENGWSNYQGKWYYYQNGIAYTGWAGAYYVRNGEMVCNSIV